MVELVIFSDDSICAKNCIFSIWPHIFATNSLGLVDFTYLPQRSNGPPRPHSIPRMLSRISAVSASRASMSAMMSSGVRSAAASGALGFFTERS